MADTNTNDYCVRTGATLPHYRGLLGQTFSLTVDMYSLTEISSIVLLYLAITVD